MDINHRLQDICPSTGRRLFAHGQTGTGLLLGLCLTLTTPISTAAPVRPDLRVSISASPTSIGTGDSVRYGVLIANPMSSVRICELNPDTHKPICTFEPVGADAGNVRVDVSVTAGSVTAASGSSGFTCSRSTPTQWSCTGGWIEQDSNASINFIAQAPLTAGTLVGSATADPASAITERLESNNTAAASVSVVAPSQPLPDLAPTASATATSTMTGPAVDYWVYINNMGNASASNVRFRVNTNFAARFGIPYIFSGGWSCGVNVAVPPYFWMDCWGGSIAAHGVTSFKFSIGTNTRGPNCLSVVADPNNEIQEMDLFGNSTAACVNMP